MSVDSVARIEAFLGAPESGKSWAMKRRIEAVRPRRLFIFDPQGEYRQYGTATDKLARAGELSGARAFGVIFQPSDDADVAKKQFDVFSKLAYHRGDCMLVADELADVTTASWAPNGWRLVLRKGRHRDMHILAASQRPAEMHKGVLSFATRIRCGRLNTKGDLDTVANFLHVPADSIAQLPPRHFIERDMTTGQITAG